MSRDWNEKLSICAEEITVHEETLKKKSTYRMLMREFSNVAGYKTKRQKPTAFLHISNKENIIKTV